MHRRSPRRSEAIVLFAVDVCQSGSIESRGPSRIAARQPRHRPGRGRALGRFDGSPRASPRYTAGREEAAIESAAEISLAPQTRSRDGSKGGVWGAWLGFPFIRMQATTSYRKRNSVVVSSQCRRWAPRCRLPLSPLALGASSANAQSARASHRLLSICRARRRAPRRVSAAAGTSENVAQMCQTGVPEADANQNLEVNALESFGRSPKPHALRAVSPI